MATLIFKNAYVALGGTDLSSWVRSVTLNDNTEMQDETAMGDSSRINKPGLFAWDVAIEFNQDYASGGPDATINALRGTTFTFATNPNSSTTGTSNPRYSGTVALESYNPVSGTVGDLTTCSVQLRSASDLARATS